MIFGRYPEPNLALQLHNSTRNIVVTQGDKLTSKRYRLLLLLYSFLSVFRSRWSLSFLCVFLSVLHYPRFGNLASLKPMYPLHLLLSIGAEPSMKPLRFPKVFSVDSERSVACCDVFTACHTSTFLAVLSPQCHSDLKIPFVSAEYGTCLTL